MAKFRKQPAEVEAVQLFNDNVLDVYRWVGDDCEEWSTDPPELRLRTLHGTVLVEESDWVIRGEAGDFWPCRSDIFTATYEPVEVLEP